MTEPQLSPPSYDVRTVTHTSDVHTHFYAITDEKTADVPDCMTFNFGLEPTEINYAPPNNTKNKNQFERNLSISMNIMIETSTFRTFEHQSCFQVEIY